MSYGMSIGGHLFQNDYGVTPSQKPVRGDMFQGEEELP